MFKGRDYYPGLGDGQNKSINLMGVTSLNVNFEQHASVPGLKVFGLNMMGFDIMNVAQQMNLSLSGNKFFISAGRGIKIRR